MRKRSDAAATGGPQSTNAPPSHVRGDMVLLGRISGAQGLHGEVRIATFTEAPENIAAYGPLTGGDGREFRIVAVRPLKGALVVARLDGVGGRNAAEALRGVELHVARESLPPPDDGEWYVGDLVGLAAVSPDGASLGELIAVQNFGAGDLLEIRPSGDGDARTTLLVPFTEAAVPIVDMPGGRVVVLPPDEIDASTPDI